ncbi:MAG: hypothetical protein V1487_01455 [bacterium]
MCYRNRVILGLFLSFTLVVSLIALGNIPPTSTNWILIGLIVSLIPSFGGAWKDAPIEGFEYSKFPRSFLVMFCCIWLLHFHTDNLIILVMASAGLERLLVEFYKTFIIKSTPGKFIGTIIAPQWLYKRKIFFLLYILTLILLIISSIL